MNIHSLTQLGYNRQSKRWNFFLPTLSYYTVSKESFYQYTVQKGEEMRMDLVMLSMYEDNIEAIGHMDVILYINDIDNPLNIVEGMVLIYPPDMSQLDSYRVTLSETSNTGRNVRKQLAFPNKSSKKDPARKKFLENDYLLPPVVLESARKPVRLENGKIIIGGI